jgi:ribosomal protein L34E
MAFLDGVGKAIGKASQGISDAAQTINTVAQDTRDNIVRERRDKQLKNEMERQEEQERVAEEARKCPKCGQPLSGISAVCPVCGYEVRSAKTANSISELTKEINKLEQKRNTITDAISTKVSKHRYSPTDEKIASLILNFIVPNTKEDIFEFMILAAGNMDTRFLAGKGPDTQVAVIVTNAWANKFTQTYQKAKFSFGEDSDFKKIQELYDKKMQEIEDAKRFSLFRRR